jgi:hypothetical protein
MNRAGRIPWRLAVTAAAIAAAAAAVSALQAVSCASATACTAVGWSHGTGPTATLAERSS